VGDPASGVANGVNGNRVGTLAAPLDPALGPLTTDNGGLTPTMAPLAGSPALDAGTNAAVTAANFPGGPPFFDQRGAGFARTAFGTVDVGAFEA
jgi:hypothetical protein